MAFIKSWISTGDATLHCALLAEYGQGKSVFVQKLALELLEEFETYQRIPILIELGGRSPRTESGDRLIEHWAAQNHIDPYLARMWVEEGQAILIFDAFDEMDMVGDRALRLENFYNIWEFAYKPRARLIITGRPNLFWDQDELREALRLRDTAPTRPHSQAIYLRKFERSQIVQALLHWPGEIRDGILAAYDAAGERSELSDLLARPSTLAQTASVWQKMRAALEEGAVNSSVVVQKFLLATYERQQRKYMDENLGARPMLTINELAYFMWAVAIAMAKQNGGANSIDRSYVRDVVIKVLGNFPAELTLRELGTEEERPERLGKPLGEFVREQKYGVERVVTQVCGSGILVDDPSNLERYRMAHKSFLEYLVGETIFYDYFWKLVGRGREVHNVGTALGWPVKEGRLWMEPMIFLLQLIAVSGLENRMEIAPSKWQRLAIRYLGSPWIWLLTMTCAAATIVPMWIILDDLWMVGELGAPRVVLVAILPGVIAAVPLGLFVMASMAVMLQSSNDARIFVANAIINRRDVNLVVKTLGWHEAAWRLMDDFDEIWIGGRAFGRQSSTLGVRMMAALRAAKADRPEVERHRYTRLRYSELAMKAGLARAEERTEGADGRKRKVIIYRTV